MNDTPVPPPQNAWARSQAASAALAQTVPNAPAPPPLKRRPPIALFILSFFAGLCLLAVATFHHYQTAPVVIPTPARPVPPPAARNGFDALKNVAAKTVRPDDVLDANSRTPKRLWTLAQRQALVAANRDALDGAKAALRLPYEETNRSTSLNDTYPWYVAFRQLARVQSLAGTVAWQENKPRDAAAYWLDAVTIGRRVPNRTIMIGRLVGLACEAIGRHPLWDHVEKMDAGTAAYCLARMNALQSENLPLSVTLEEEKWFTQNAVLDAINHPKTFHVGGSDSETDKEGASSDTVPAMKAYNLVVSRKVAVDSIGAHMDKVIAQSKKPYIQDHREIEPPKEIYTSTVAPASAPLRCKYTTNEAGDALLRTALALRVYRLKKGDYPANLAALVSAKLLPAVPDDPFALPRTPLCYRRTDKDHYVLYSIGPDGRDDNGRGIVGKSTSGAETRYVSVDSKGDMRAGWYEY